MKLRKKVNGDVDDYPEAEAERLLSTFPSLFEKVDEERTTRRKDVTAESSAQTYKRRDIRPSP